MLFNSKLPDTEKQKNKINVLCPCHKREGMNIFWDIPTKGFTTDGLKPHVGRFFLKIMV